MREGKVVHAFQIVILDIKLTIPFKYDVYPSEQQMKEAVSKYFPTFHVDGDRITWKVEKIYFIED